MDDSHLIKENVAEEIAKLKQQSGQDILVAGSSMLVQTLIHHRLIDEFHLLLYPVVLGNGKRLFKDATTTNLKLVNTRAFSSGVVLLSYVPCASVACEGP